MLSKQRADDNTFTELMALLIAPVRRVAGAETQRCCRSNGYGCLAAEGPSHLGVLWLWCCGAEIRNLLRKVQDAMLA